MAGDNDFDFVFLCCLLPLVWVTLLLTIALIVTIAEVL